MRKSKINILLSSDVDYEKLIAEIYIDKHYIALLNQDEGKDSIKIEFPDDNSPCSKIINSIDLKVLEEAIKLAKKKLLEE